MMMNGSEKKITDFLLKDREKRTNELEEKFYPNHCHFIINAKLRKPPILEDVIKDWLRRLVSKLDMTILDGPYVCTCTDEGNEGVTGFVIISTSHCSIHVWPYESIPYANIDIYSCKHFDVNRVQNLLMEFDPYYYQYGIIDRNDGKNLKEWVGYKQCVKIIDLLSVEQRKLYTKKNYWMKNRGKFPEKYKEFIKIQSMYNGFAEKFSFKGAQRVRKYRNEHNSIIANIKSRSKRKGFFFDLDKNWYTDELAKAHKVYPKLLETASLFEFWSPDVDRINPSKGYTKNNCRIIPHGLNVAKFNWSSQELRELLNLLRNDVFEQCYEKRKRGGAK